MSDTDNAELATIGHAYNQIAMAAQIATLEAENTRLREALETIVSEADSDDGLTAWDGGDIARAALTPSKEPRKDPSP